MPGVESCTVDGDVRTIGMMGIEIKEQLRDLDDDDPQHLVLASSSRRWATSSRTSRRSRSSPRARARTSRGPSTSLPDELLGLFLPVYEGSVVELKKKLEA